MSLESLQKFAYSGVDFRGAIPGDVVGGMGNELQRKVFFLAPFQHGPLCCSGGVVFAAKKKCWAEEFIGSIA